MDAISVGARSGAATGGAPLVGSEHMGNAAAVAAKQVAAPNSGTGADANGEPDESVHDSRRNWSPEMLLELAKIYKRVALANPDLGRMGVMQLVFEEFRTVVDCSNRSRKAVDDKLYSMKQMYHFIMKMNGNFKLGYRNSVPTWFELSKQERRAIRSLHRVRTPNITLEVFRLLDSVLNPNPSISNESEDAAASATASPTSVIAAGSAPATVSAVAIPDVVDAKRNWSDDVTLELAKAWNAAHQQNPSLRGAMLSHQVYNAFMTTVGFSNRSRKAVDDKMHSMREMYRFIRTYEAQREAGENKPGWFDLTKKERREMRARYKIRVTNLTREVYDEIDQLMSRSSFEPEDEETSDAAVSGADAHPQVVMPPSEISSGEASAGLQLLPTPVPSTPVSFVPATSALIQVASHPTNYVVVPQMMAAPTTVQPSRVAPVLQSSPSWPTADIGNTHLPAAGTIALSVNANEVVTEPASKRQRTQPNPDTASPTSSSDASIAHAVCEQLRLLHEQDRQERLRQHAEQMAVLREIASLLRQKP